MHSGRDSVVVKSAVTHRHSAEILLPPVIWYSTRLWSFWWVLLVVPLTIYLKRCFFRCSLRLMIRRCGNRWWLKASFARYAVSLKEGSDWWAEIQWVFFFDDTHVLYRFFRLSRDVVWAPGAGPILWIWAWNVLHTADVTFHRVLTNFARICVDGLVLNVIDLSQKIPITSLRPIIIFEHDIWRGLWRSWWSINRI